MDWQKLLGELSEAGMTQQRIAARCGVAQSTISDLSRGKTLEPSFSLGVALQQLAEAGTVVEDARNAA